jgi:hypothetical protein
MQAHLAHDAAVDNEPSAFLLPIGEQEEVDMANLISSTAPSNLCKQYLTARILSVCPLGIKHKLLLWDGTGPTNQTADKTTLRRGDLYPAFGTILPFFAWKDFGPKMNLIKLGTWVRMTGFIRKLKDDFVPELGSTDNHFIFDILEPTDAVVVKKMEEAQARQPLPTQLPPHYPQHQYAPPHQYNQQHQYHPQYPQTPYQYQGQIQPPNGHYASSRPPVAYAPPVNSFAPPYHPGPPLQEETPISSRISTVAPNGTPHILIDALMSKIAQLESPEPFLVVAPLLAISPLPSETLKHDLISHFIVQVCSDCDSVLPSHKPGCLGEAGAATAFLNFHLLIGNNDQIVQVEVSGDDSLNFLGITSEEVLNNQSKLGKRWLELEKEIGKTIRLIILVIPHEGRFAFKLSGTKFETP